MVLITKNNKKQGIYLPLKNIKGIILLNKKERKIKNEIYLGYFIFYPSEATDCACRIHLVSHLFIFLNLNSTKETGLKINPIS